MTAVVRQLSAHPLKSAEVTPTGFRHDREFMLVRPDGMRLSQREVPRMAVEGLGPYGEDSVNLLRVGEVEIELIKPCNPLCDHYH